jgi:RNA-binding protein
MSTLSAKQRKHLRKLGHALKSIVQIGHKGVTESVVAQIDQALLDHELIKVKVGKNSEVELGALCDVLNSSFECTEVQTIGGVVTLYRQAEEPEDRKIRLPSE